MFGRILKLRLVHRNPLAPLPSFQIAVYQSMSDYVKGLRRLNRQFGLRWFSLHLVSVDVFGMFSEFMF